MTQYFSIINLHKPSDTIHKFMWNEEDENGVELAGFIHTNLS